MGKVIILTGASRGIGYALAKILLAPPFSAKVVGVSRTEGPLKELSQENKNFTYVVGDLQNESTSEAAVEKAIDTFGQIDSLVLNAAVLDPVSRIADSKAEEWKTLFDVNFFSLISLVSKSIPYLRQSKGRVIFISSGAATSNYAGWGAYGSSKAALNHFAATLAEEEPDIFTVSIAPGVVDTSMQTNIRDNHSEAMGDNHKKFVTLKATGQLLTPETPASIIANLSIKGAGDINGKFYRYNAPELGPYRD